MARMNKTQMRNALRAIEGKARKLFLEGILSEKDLKNAQLMAIRGHKKVNEWQRTSMSFRRTGYR